MWRMVLKTSKNKIAEYYVEKIHSHGGLEYQEMYWLLSDLLHRIQELEGGSESTTENSND